MALLFPLVMERVLWVRTSFGRRDLSSTAQRPQSAAKADTAPPARNTPTPRALRRPEERDREPFSRFGAMLKSYLISQVISQTIREILTTRFFTASEWSSNLILTFMFS